MDGFSCTECGRCQDACPAYATGKILSPKLLIMGVRDQVLAQSTEPIVGNGVPEEMIWDCVTCGACVEACPVSIEHIDHIVDLRRSRVMVDSAFPAEAEPMLRDVERAGNPWGKPQTERAAWAEELGVRVLEPGDPAPEYLYWVGCAASFDERAKKTRRVDGEAAAEGGRRLRDPRPARVVHRRPRAADGQRVRLPGVRRAERRDAERATACRRSSRAARTASTRSRTSTATSAATTRCCTTRSCWRELVDDGRLKPAAGAKSITYHDSCYLARHNDVRMEPRKLLNVIGQPVEMKRSGKQTFCCGAGGAHMWMEERGTQINVERAREAAETGAETLAVACPFCTVMLDDGVREPGRSCVSPTSSTLLAESLDA